MKTDSFDGVLDRKRRIDAVLSNVNGNPEWNERLLGVRVMES